MTYGLKPDATAHQSKPAFIEANVTCKSGFLDAVYFDTVDADGKPDRIMVRFDTMADLSTFFGLLASTFDKEVTLALNIDTSDFHEQVYRP